MPIYIYELEAWGRTLDLQCLVFFRIWQGTSDFEASPLSLSLFSFSLSLSLSGHLIQLCQAYEHRVMGTTKKE